MISLQGSGLHALSNSSRFGLSICAQEDFVRIVYQGLPAKFKKKNGDDFCNVELPSWDFNNDLKFDDFWIRPFDHFCQDGDSHFLKRNPPRTPPGNRCKHGYDFNLIGVHAILHHATCRQRFLGGVRGGSRLNQNRCLKSIGLY